MFRVPEPRSIEDEERRSAMWSTADDTRVSHRPVVPRRWKTKRRSDKPSFRICAGQGFVVQWPEDLKPFRRWRLMRPPPAPKDSLYSFFADSTIFQLQTASVDLKIDCPAGHRRQMSLCRWNRPRNHGKPWLHMRTNPSDTRSIRYRKRKKFPRADLTTVRVHTYKKYRTYSEFRQIILLNDMKTIVETTDLTFDLGRDTVASQGRLISSSQ